MPPLHNELFPKPEVQLPFPIIDPIAFSLGPLAVRWYALAYLVGIGLGLLYCINLLRNRSMWPQANPPFTITQCVDFTFWAVLGVIAGGRLGYIIFYKLWESLADPLSIFQVWNGGMSFHGGLLGVMVALFFFAKFHKANVLSSLDLLATAAPIGLFLGRVANFLNAELYGRATDWPWGVVFPGGGDEPRHPSQLYEAALEGIVLFIVLRLITHVWHGLKRPGLVAGTFAIGYALSRLLVEQVRLPDDHIGYLWNGWLTMGMVLTMPMLLAGLIMVIYARSRPISLR